MSQVTVRELQVFPVKGCQGVPVDQLDITELGIVGDREFVIWEDGQLVDQKDTPQVAALGVDLDRAAGRLRFSHPDHGAFEHEIREHGDLRKAKWVLDDMETIDQGDAVADWLGQAVGRPVRLVSPGAPWKINFPIPQMERLHTQPKHRFFAASPVSLANQASLDDLNARLDEPVPMDRFRINVVVDGMDAYAEDHIDRIGNGDAELLQVTPAERCVIITTDQKTGNRPKTDLMKVLSDYRRKPAEERFGSGVIFGNYMTVGKPGTLRVGDRLTVA
ncbi:MAG: MOSC N-terminal beta barrel domain-containing protein [Myxococcota bacterium]